MVIAPGDDFVKIVARGDCGAGQEQRVDDPPRLTFVIEPGKCFGSRATRALGTSSSVKKSAVLSMWRPQVIRGAERTTPPCQSKIAVNLTSGPCLPC